MTRLDRLLAVITEKLEQNRPSIDADCDLREVTVTVKLNDGGVPRLVTLRRESMEDLRERPRLTTS